MSRSNRQVGRYYERLCKAKLESLGWLVYLVPPKQRFAKQEDIFHVFDLIALNKPKKLFIQVKKDDAHVKKTVKELREFRVKHLIKSDLVQLWNWRKGSKRIKRGWYITNVDECEYNKKGE